MLGRLTSEATDAPAPSSVAPSDTDTGSAVQDVWTPGYREDFWFLDIEGTRLMIAAERSPGSPSEDLAELDDILGSIRIEP